jgi:hypothetical protein
MYEVVFASFVVSERGPQKVECDLKRVVVR